MCFSYGVYLCCQNTRSSWLFNRAFIVVVSHLSGTRSECTPCGAIHALSHTIEYKYVLSIEIEPRFFKLRRGRLYTIQNPLIFCIILQQISRKDYDLQEALSQVRVLSRFVYIFIITDMSARQRTSDMGALTRVENSLLWYNGVLLWSMNRDT